MSDQLPQFGTSEKLESLEPWIIHGTRSVYENFWAKVELWDVEPPGVERFEHHVVTLHPVAITAVLDNDDHVLMLWRYRFVSRQWGWELPGGIVEAGEDAGVAALREVEEETGWRPKELQRLATFQPMNGMVDSPHNLFLARGATYIREPSDPEEVGHVAWVPLSDIPVLMSRGDLMGAGTLVALLHILAHPALHKSAGTE